MGRKPVKIEGSSECSNGGGSQEKKKAHLKIQMVEEARKIDNHLKIQMVEKARKRRRRSDNSNGQENQGKEEGVPIIQMVKKTGKIDNSSENSNGGEGQKR